MNSFVYRVILLKLVDFLIIKYGHQHTFDFRDSPDFVFHLRKTVLC